MRRGSSFKTITQNKGGGILLLDIDKTDTLEDLLEKITTSFFPNGVNEEQNLRLENFNYFMASFTGVPIEVVSPNGDAIHVGTYTKRITTSPLRIYLHTQPKVRVKCFLKTTFNCIKLFILLIFLSYCF